MSPVTGLARLPGRILWSLHMRNFSPVDRDEIQETKTKMVKHKLVSFATVVALWTLETLLIKLIRMLLKWKYIHDKNYTILAALMRKRSYFVKKFRPGHPGWSVHMKKFHPGYRGLGPKNRDLGNRAGPASRERIEIFT